MLNRNLMLGCLIAALTACGGQGSLDLGPNNPDFGKEPPPTTEEPPVDITYDWDFEDESQVADWRTGSVLAVADPGQGNDCDLDTTISKHFQSSALQITPTVGWKQDFEDMCAMGFLSQPRAMQGGKIQLSVYLPSFYTNQNPWNTDADENTEDDRFNFGLQVILEDANGNRADAASWKNVYELLGLKFNAAGFGYQQRTPDPSTGDVAGRWFDLSFDATKYVGADAGFDINALVGVGIRLVLRDTNTNLPWEDNAQYVFVDNVLLLPPEDGYEPPPPPPPPPPAAPSAGGLHPVTNPGLVFFDFNAEDGEKGSWWGDVGLTYEDDPAVSVDGTGYGRVNFQTGDDGWKGLFWRNGSTMHGQNVVADNLTDFVLKFDINVFTPIEAGVIKIRFKDGDGEDVFYDWAPWTTSGEPFSTNGWETIVIPLTELGVPDFSLVDEDFGMAFQGADALLDFAIDNVRFDYPRSAALDAVDNQNLVFFDFNAEGGEKGSWWGDVGLTYENDSALTVDGTGYGRVNFQTGDDGWKGLFWRNGSTMHGQNVVADQLRYYSLKFDINVLSPIDAGVIKIRFKDGDGEDVFYDWAPWGIDNPFQTKGWVTIEIPVSELGVPDFSLVDEDFGMAYQGADILLDFAIDNVRFEASGDPDIVDDYELVFFDFNKDDGDDKDSWWDDVGLTYENDPNISLDGTSYGWVNYETGGDGWKGLFWRNGGTMFGQDVVADNLNYYALKFDIYVLAPIDAGVFKIRFKDGDGEDAFYEWAPWAESGTPYLTPGWTTISIPVKQLGVPDFSLVDEDFGMAFEGADILLNFAIDNVRFELLDDPKIVEDQSLVFFDFNDEGGEKASWWGDVGLSYENDPNISIDGTSYGWVDFQTGDDGWKGLFWRNGSTMHGQDVVADNLNDYELRFDIYVFEPISAGVFKIRFKDGDGEDVFYDWAPWEDNGAPYQTFGWTTVRIPLTNLGVPDFSLVDEDFGMAYQGADTLLKFAIDNVRFAYTGD